MGPDNDVTALSAALSDDDFGLHDPANIQLVIDGTKSAVIDAMKSFFKSAIREEQLLIFISTHGIPDADGNLHFATHDTADEDLIETSVPMAELNALAGETRAEAVAILLDCCYSGGMKSPQYEYALDGRGRWILASCESHQMSTASPTPDGLSVFTKHLISALTANDAVDLDHDGYVTIADIDRHISPLIEKESGQRVTRKYESTGELVVALGTNYPSHVEMSRPWTTRNGRLIQVPSIPQLEQKDSVIDATDPIADPTTNTDPFTEIIEALDNNKDSTVRRTLKTLARSAKITAVGESIESATGDLDQLTKAVAAFVEVDSLDWLNHGLTGFVRVYETGFSDEGFARHHQGTVEGIHPAKLWWQIYLRILTLGAFAVREENWAAARSIAMQRPDGYDFKRTNNWLRHAQTEAARGRFYNYEPNNGKTIQSPLTFAAELAAAHESLHLGTTGELEKLLPSLCQFDALADIAAISEAGTLDGSNYCPNFDIFPTRYTEPFFRKLVSDDNLRETVAPGVEDKRLCAYMDAISSKASPHGFWTDGWEGFDDPTILNWMEKATK